MEQLIGMTDTAFLGRVGEVELGASAIAGVYYLAIFMMAFGFSIGAQILIARRNGEQQYQAIGPIFYQGVYFLLSLAVVAFTLSLCFSPHILKRSLARSIYTMRPSATSTGGSSAFLLLCRSNVSCILRGYNSDQNPDTELCGHGIIQCGVQLHTDFR